MRYLRATVLTLAVLGLGVLGANGAGFYRTHDFYALYSGARIVAEGGDPYDEVLWCAETEDTTPQAFDRARNIAVCFVRYAYPLWTAVALLPLGILPLPLAASLWLALSIALTIAALRWSWLAVGGHASWAPVFVAIVVFSQPFALLLTLGQTGAVMFAVAAFTAYGAARSRDRAAGIALAGAVFKPNVLVVFALAILGWAALMRRANLVLTSLAAGAVLLAFSLSLRPGWMGSWFGELFGRQIGHSVEYATAWGLAAVDLHDPSLAPVLIVALAVALVLIARGRLGDPVVLSAVTVPLSLFATPYAWSYDYLALGLSWAYVLAAAGRSSRSAGPR